MLESYDNFLLDCDGVLYNGPEELGRAFDTVEWLLAQGKKVFFITNGSGKTRQNMVDAFHKMGLSSAKPNMMYGSAYTTANYLREVYPEIKYVRVVGMDSIREELKAVGIESEGGQERDSFQPEDMNIDFYRTVEVNPEVQAVIVGLDTNFNYHKLAMANLHLQSGAHGGKPARFIACNNDAWDSVGGLKYPGAGALIQAIMTSLNNEDGGQRTEPPELTGKPNPFVVDLILRHNSLDKSRSIIIGDRLDTDILLGANAGIDSCLVLTGVTSSTEVARDELEENP